MILDLYNNNMTGELPMVVVEMPSLVHLPPWRKLLRRKYPAGSTAAGENLEYLAVSGNELGGAIPPEIGNLTKLKELYVGYFNSYTGGIPPEMGTCRSLCASTLLTAD
ncbi:hypothetical protein Ancab_026176 [Ancistrocladus abbreviatus]